MTAKQHAARAAVVLAVAQRRMRRVVALTILPVVLVAGIALWRPWETRAPAIGPTLRPAARAPLPAPAVIPESAQVVRVPATPLMLLGTFAYQDPTAGSALVGPTPQSASLYATQTEVAPGVFLREVYASYIVIERDGVREVLGLAPRGRGDGLVEAARAPRPEPPAIGMQDTVRVAVAAADEPPGIPGVQGVRVYAGRNRNGLAQLGLHPGDLVTEINGVPIGGQQSTDILGLIQDGLAATATVFRAGKLQQVTLHASADPGTPNPAASVPDDSSPGVAAMSR